MTSRSPRVLAELRRIHRRRRNDGARRHEELPDGSFPSTVQTSTDIAGRQIDMELYDLPTNYFDRYRENIGPVSKHDVEHVAEKYIDPEKVIIVIVGNASQIREPLV